MMTKQRNPLYRLRVLALGLALALPTAQVRVPAAYAAENTAAAMQLTKTEGTVDITNASEKKVSLIENMRLYNGYQVETKAKSYAWVELDRVKLAKLDASSKVSIRKQGKKLEILLESGSLFFNITEPLKDDESLNIRTATMVAGIRGTSGWIDLTDDKNVKVYVLEGSVEVGVTDPVSGQSKTDSVSGGQSAVCAVYEQPKEGNKCEILRASYAKEEISGFILKEVASDTSLAEKIFEKGGVDLRSVTVEAAQERLVKDEKVAQQKQEEAAKGESKTVTTYDEPEGTGSYSEAPTTPAPPPSESSPATRPSEPETSPATRPSEPETSPATKPSDPGTSPATKPSESESSPATKPSESESADDVVTLNFPVGWETVDAELKKSNVGTVIVANDPNDSSSQVLEISGSLTIPNGKTLSVDLSGSSVNLTDNETVSAKIMITSQGSLQVEDNSTLDINGILVNHGTITNDGTMIGTVILEDTSKYAALTNNGEIDGNGKTALYLKGVWHYITLNESSWLTTSSNDPTVRYAGNEVIFFGGTIENGGDGPALEWIDDTIVTWQRIQKAQIRAKTAGVTTKRNKQNNTVTTAPPSGFELSGQPDDDGWYYLQEKIDVATSSNAKAARTTQLSKETKQSTSQASKETVQSTSQVSKETTEADSQASDETKQASSQASDETKQATSQASDEMKQASSQASDETKQVTSQASDETRQVTAQASDEMKQATSQTAEDTSASGDQAGQQTTQTPPAVLPTVPGTKETEQAGSQSDADDASNPN